VIDQSSVCEAGYSVSNSTSNKMENSDSRSEVAIASEPKTVAEQRHYHDKSSEDREMDDFHDSVYKERVNKEIIQSIGKKKIRDQESLTTLPEEERPQDLNLDAQSRNNTSSEVSANSDGSKLPPEGKICSETNSKCKKSVGKLKQELFTPELSSQEPSIEEYHTTEIPETSCPGKVTSGSKSHGSAIDSNLEESETRSFASSPDDNKSYDGDTNDNGDFDVNQLPVENFFDDDSRGEDANATRDNENDDEFSDNNEEEDDGGYCGFSNDDEGYYYDLNTGETYTKSEYRYSIRAY
ncbi:12227_t:CDS:2, partial [Ambispora leptoticha]